MSNTLSDIEMPSVGKQAPSIPRDDRELVSRFASLGDNCEFGLLQRYVGNEAPSLFRFNFTRLDRLIAGLENRFADLAMSENVRVEWDSEWIVKEIKYGFSYHTFNADRGQDQAQLINQQISWLTRMARKFMDGLPTDDRIYVRKGQLDSIQSANLLSWHLRKHGPATLLWVTIADADHPCGTVEWIGEGLMRGWLRGFAPYDRAADLEPRSWLELLRRAWALRYLTDPNAFPSGDQKNLLSPNFDGWTGTPSATAEFVWSVPTPPDKGQVMKHVSIRGTETGNSIFGCLVKAGLSPGALYVASVYVWIEAVSTVTSAGIVLLGRATLRGHLADLNKRDTWQMIWVCAFLDDIDIVAFPQLTVAGPPGATVYSSGWRLEAGTFPRLTSSERRADAG
jgi:hypothetical protein